MAPSHDLRDTIFKDVMHKSVLAEIRAQGQGILCGTGEVTETAKKMDLDVIQLLPEGSSLTPEELVMKFSGTPKQVLAAEEVLIGLMAKPSGIASMAHQFVRRADGKIKIVAGAWKKMPPSLKSAIRRAVAVGGAQQRIVNGPFIYLDKNYTAIFNGIAQTLRTVSSLEEHVKVIHIRGAYKDIVLEAGEAVENGAGVLFVDTGRAEDVIKVTDYLRAKGDRERVSIAFGGSITFEDLGHLLTLDIDILDVGREILDAPLLDMRMVVIDVN
jgi:nicotinate-nucleotide pyrophosphorylase (carboxylating)